MELRRMDIIEVETFIGTRFLDARIKRDPCRMDRTGRLCNVSTGCLVRRLPSWLRRRGASVEKSPNGVDCGPHVSGGKVLINETGNLVRSKNTLPLALPVGLRTAMRFLVALASVFDLNVEPSL